MNFQIRQATWRIRRGAWGRNIRSHFQSVRGKFIINVVADNVDKYSEKLESSLESKHCQCGLQAEKMKRKELTLTSWTLACVTRVYYQIDRMVTRDSIFSCLSWENNNGPSRERTAFRSNRKESL
jgi:hypothetical protein